ncbi:MAG: 2-amino-4-hydroxy-6-hydroxymethyldihydropteridine diphosphokinase [Muribaculaceae bacterium]|nr:2-amino-4-hydroxy-6-hydroxymethyldihydropteridine diphosphokinase [Muribaculaceae bacterium]
MNKVILSLGSNFGDRRRNVEEGIACLKEILTEMEFSDIYETPECHGKGTLYYNCVVKGTTEMTFSRLKDLLNEYEFSCGRTPDARERGEVVIDIDIVVFNDDIKRQEDYGREFFQIGFRQLKRK